jgi:hypothetical protein
MLSRLKRVAFLIIALGFLYYLFTVSVLKRSDEIADIRTNLEAKSRASVESLKKDLTSQLNEQQLKVEKCLENITNLQQSHALEIRVRDARLKYQEYLCISK